MIERIRMDVFVVKDLSVSVRSEHDGSEVELVEDAMNPSAVNVDRFSCRQEWRLHPVVNVWHKVTVKRSRDKRVLVRQPGFCVAARVSRRPRFFMSQIVP